MYIYIYIHVYIYIYTHVIYVYINNETPTDVWVSLFETQRPSETLPGRPVRWFLNPLERSFASSLFTKHSTLSLPHDGNSSMVMKTAQTPISNKGQHGTTKKHPLHSCYSLWLFSKFSGSGLWIWNELNGLLKPAHLLIFGYQPNHSPGSEQHPSKVSWHPDPLRTVACEVSCAPVAGRKI